MRPTVNASMPHQSEKADSALLGGGKKQARIGGLDETSGEAEAVPLAPLELYQKIYVHPSFLESDHGALPCTDCHGGDDGDPTGKPPMGGWCGIPPSPERPRSAATATRRLRLRLPTACTLPLTYSGGGLRPEWTRRRGLSRRRWVRPWKNTAPPCHASCGQCHVSRPDYADGGFLSRHNFVKNPSHGHYLRRLPWRTGSRRFYRGKRRQCTRRAP